MAKLWEFVWEYLRPLLGIKKYSQILYKNTSPYFFSASPVIWPLTMLKRTHSDELSISRFITYIREAQGFPYKFLWFRHDSGHNSYFARWPFGAPVAKAEIHCSPISLERKNLATINICRPGKISFQFVGTERETVKISTCKVHCIWTQSTLCVS